MVSSVNKYKPNTSLTVVKLLHQTPSEETREHNIKKELGVRKSEAMESSSAKIIQSQTITSFCMTRITNQITITGFCTYLTSAITD